MAGSNSSVEDDKKSLKWFQAGLLCIMNVFNYMDRFAVSGVLIEVEKEFQMDDKSQSGLLQTAFVICYFLSAPLFGFLGDRYSRRILLIFASSAWILASFVGTFMPDYVTFLLIRASIGFGEAGFTAIASTILGDLFMQQQRTLALALFCLAIPVGSGLGYIVSSQVAVAANDWRWGLRVIPILVLAALVLVILFLEDPPRGANNDANLLESHSEEVIMMDKLKSWRDDVLHLLATKSYIFASLAHVFLSFFTTALTFWAPHYVEDVIKFRNVTLGAEAESDMKLDDVTFMFGLTMVLAGVVGLSLGSGMSMWLRHRFRWIDPILCGGGLMLSFPLLVISLYICPQNVSVSFAFMFITMVFINMNWAILMDLTLYVVVPTKWVTANALQILLVQGLGEVSSPYLVGIVMEAFKASLSETYPLLEEVVYISSAYSLYIVSAAVVVTAVMFFICAIFVTNDWKKALAEAEALTNSLIKQKQSNQDCPTPNQQSSL